MPSSMLQFAVASLALVGSYVSAYLANAGQKVEARQTNATIKQIIGTWSYKGCYLDNPNRLLTYRFDVLGGNAEQCTSLCASNGYGLAGLEYGQECWCDKYMPFDANTVRKPDTDCSFMCPGDETELCGAGDRLALYQNSAGIPPDPTKCTDWRESTWTERLRAVNRDGTGSPVDLWNYYINDVNDPINYNIISVNYPQSALHHGSIPESLYRGLVRMGLVPMGLNAGYYRTPPTSGVLSKVLWLYGLTLATLRPSSLQERGPQNRQYHLLLEGSFFGYPLLSVNGDTNKWGLCTNTTTGSNGRRDIVYSPIANHAHYDLDERDIVNIEAIV